MPRHKQVTTCLKSGGPVSKFCTCMHCTISVCQVCGAYEGSLTTDCPGERADFDRQREVYETNLDFTKARGWHQGEPMKRRVPRFETDTAILHHELAQRAIAWVEADRICDDRAAALTRVEDEVDARLRARCAQDMRNAHVLDGELIAKLKREEVDFRLADQRAQKCDEKFREAARKLVDALEQQALTTTNDPAKGTGP